MTRRSYDDRNASTYAKRAVRDLGAEHGRNAASWVELSEDTAQNIDRDGVFETLGDGFESPLSSEWADSYNIHDLSDDLGVDEGDDEFDDLCREYEDAYFAGFEAEVLRMVETLRGPVPTLDVDATYTVDGMAKVAWVVDGFTFGGMVRVHMVGDDREHIVDAEDLRPAPGHCLECGQVGCYGGIRSDDDDDNIHDGGRGNSRPQ